MPHDFRACYTRELRAFYYDLSLVSQWEELIECSLLHLAKLVPNECLCWNEWSPGFGAPKRIEVVDDYHEAALSLIPSLAATIDNHPVIVKLGWDGLANSPLRLSDFQCQADFRENPLFKEVYIFLDSYHQLVYKFASTSSAELIITMNRRLRDFDNTERELLKLAGDCIAPIAQAIHQRDDALNKANILTDAIEQTYGLVNVDQLSSGEVFLLKELASGLNVSTIAKRKQVRRDTVSRQLSIAREKLALGSNKELISALCFSR